MGKRKGKTAAQLANLAKARAAKAQLHVAKNTASPRNIIIPVTHIHKYIGDHAQCNQCSKGALLPNGYSGRGGFDTVLNFKCSHCNAVSTLVTSPSITTGSRKRPEFNLRMTLSAKAAGIGFDTCDKFLSGMGVNIMSKTTFNKDSATIDAAFETVARQSCMDAVFIEIDAMLVSDLITKITDEETLEKITEDIHNGTVTVLVPLAASADAMWAKRSYGHSYNSINGLVTLIGHFSGKILEYEAMQKYCGVCKLADTRGEVPHEHECHRNYVGSSKSMEPVGTFRCATRLRFYGARLGVLIGDEDTLTIHYLKENLPDDMGDITKWSDVNHVTKLFIGKLLELREVHYKKANSGFSKDMPFKLGVDFVYAVKGNEGDEAG